MKNKKRLLPLKEVCLDFIVPQRDKPTSFNGDIPWCRIEDIEGRYLNGSKSGQNVTKELADKMNMHLCPRGTVISACSASIGNQAITTTDCYTNQTFIGLVVNPDLLYNVYLYYFLESQTIALQQLGQGATIKYISKDKYKKMLIPLPSLSEQQRIVERLDAAFAHIDELKANAEKQVSEARALFQKALEKAMEPKDGWEEKTIGELFKTYSGGTPLKSGRNFYDGGNIPWIRSGEVCKKYITECEMYITEEGMNNSSAKYYPVDTVLVAMYGATAAQVGILKFEATSNQAVCGLLPRKDFMPEYVYYWFTNIKEDLAAQAQGGAQPNLSQVKIKKVIISYPSLSEQRSIVARLDSLSENVKKLEEIQRKIIAECDALKQALLRKVFE